MSPTWNNKEEILERGEKEVLLPDSAVVEDGEEGGVFQSSFGMSTFPAHALIHGDQGLDPSHWLSSFAFLITGQFRRICPIFLHLEQRRRAKRDLVE